MSQENVELARGVVGNLQALLDVIDEDVVWDNSAFADAVDFAGVHRGKEAAVAMIKTWVSAWDDYDFQVEEVVDARESCVLQVHETGRGRGSGLPLDRRSFQVWTFQDGRLVRAAVYAARHKALEAVGLSE